MAEAHIVAHSGCCLTPQSLRLLNHALVCVEGVAFDQAYGTDSLEVTPGSEGLSVVVAAGSAFIEGGQFAGEGMYFVSNDADVTLTLEGADPADPRNDLVVARVDTTATDCADAWVLEVIEGTPAPVPGTPVTPAGAIPLAVVNVPAGATTITAANITDQRSAYEYCGAPEFPYRNVYSEPMQSLNRPGEFFGLPQPVFINNLQLPRPALVMTILSATFGVGGGSSNDGVALSINYASPAFIENASRLNRTLRGNNQPLNAGSLVRLVEADAGLFTGNVFGGDGVGTIRSVEMTFRVVQWLE